MTRQRQILVTVTYNDLGCIIDTKAEPYEEPNLQPTCNQLATDCISRQAAIDAFEKECTQDESYGYIDIKSAVDVLNDLPSVKLATDLQFLQPESEYVFYDSDHGFCINTQDVLDCLRKELRNG